MSTETKNKHDAMREALRRFGDQHGRAAAFQLLKTVAGTDRMSAVPESKIGAVIAACEGTFKPGAETPAEIFGAAMKDASGKIDSKAVYAKWNASRRPDGEA